MSGVSRAPAGDGKAELLPPPLLFVQSAPAAPPAGFRPVEGGGELQSGGKLLVEAYAVLWLIFFVLVLVSRRQQARLDARLARVEEALRRARGDAALRGDRPGASGPEADPPRADEGTLRGEA